jgi:hypothetical protein
MNFLFLVGFLLALLISVKLLRWISQSAKFRRRAQTLTPIAAQQMQLWAAEAEKAKAASQYLDFKRFKACELTVYFTGYPMVDFTDASIPLRCYIPAMVEMSESELDDYLKMLDLVPDKFCQDKHIEAASNARFWRKYLSNVRLQQLLDLND